MNQCKKLSPDASGNLLFALIVYLAFALQGARTGRRRQGTSLGLAGLLVVVAVGAVLGLTPAAEATSPGENGKIAFHSNADGDFEIYTMNPDGSGLTQLTFNTSIDSRPDWSPDGTKIAFMSRRDGNNEIYVMNADGSEQI